MAEEAMVAEWPEEVMERDEVEILSQLGVSIQLAASTAQERVEVHQPGSPSVLMSTSWVAEPC